MIKEVNLRDSASIDSQSTALNTGSPTTTTTPLSVPVPVQLPVTSAQNANWTWSSYIPAVSSFVPPVLSYVPSFSTLNPLNYLPSSSAKIESSIAKPVHDFNEIKQRMTLLFGTELTTEVMQRYGIENIKSLTDNDMIALSVGIAAQMKTRDVAVMHQKLKDKSLPKELFEGENQETLVKLQNLCSNTAFNDLNDEQLNELIVYMRSYATLNLAQPQVNAFVPQLTHPSMRQPFEQDYDIFKRVTCQQTFNSKQHPESAASEFWARRPPYAALKPGMIIAGRNIETNKPMYYEVKTGIDKDGFGFFFLQGMASANQGRVIALCRGTDPNSKVSLTANLAEASGLKNFRIHKETIQKDLEVLCQTIKIPIKLEIYGHSMGGAISMHLTNSLIKKMNELAQNGKPSSLFNIESIKMSTWNAPGTLQTEDKEFCLDAEGMTRHPETTNTKIQLNYNKIDIDKIQECGEVFLGTQRSSNNIDCTVLVFPTQSYKPILGPHCTPIHDIAIEIPTTKEIILDCQNSYKLQKRVEILELLVHLKNYEVEYPSLKAKLISEEAKQQVSLIEKKGAEGLLAMAKTFDKDCKNVPPADLPILKKLIELRIQDYQACDLLTQIPAFVMNDGDWFNTMTTLMSGDLQSLIKKKEVCQAQLKQEERKIQETFKKLAPILQDTIYTNQTPVNKFTAKHILNYSKSCLDKTLDSKATSYERWKAGSTLALGAGAIAVGSSYATLPLAIIAVGAGVSVGVVEANRRIYDYLWGTR